MKVGSVTADPNVTLISGITSTDSFSLHFAYAELRDVATDGSAASVRRRSFDTKSLVNLRFPKSSLILHRILTPRKRRMWWPR
jgi:hypothetical protein